MRSQKSPKEAKYLEYLNNDTNNAIHTKINDIRKELVELGTLIDKEYRDKIRKDLDKIEKRTGITQSQRTQILNQLSDVSLNLQYKRKQTDLTYDDSNYYGLKDLKYTLGDLDDYYKPILAKESFDGNY